MLSPSVLLLKSLSGLLYIRSRLLKPVDHSSVLCTTTTTTCYYMWQLWLIAAITVLYDVRQTLHERVSAIQMVGPACWQGPTFTQVPNLSSLFPRLLLLLWRKSRLLHWGMIQEFTIGPVTTTTTPEDDDNGLVST